jgi:glycosyltransferase involved in cell wall biosynthesis
MKKFLYFLLIIFFVFFIAYLSYIQFFRNPKISIIIPCYNSEKYIQEVFSNLNAQTFSNYEVIFVDDGSTDKTNKLISKYKKNDKRAKLITLASNNGAGYARNIGLKKAKGDYVIFLDSDDIYFPDLLKESYNAAIKSNADITLFKTIYYDENSKKYSNKDIDYLWDSNYPVNKIFTPEDIKDHLFTFCRGVLWNKLYKRSFLNKYNFKFLNLKMHNDSYFVYCTYVMANSMYVTDKVLIAYRINHHTSISSSKRKYDEICKMENVKALKDFLIKENLLDKYQKSLQKYIDTF